MKKLIIMILVITVFVTGCGDDKKATKKSDYKKPVVITEDVLTERVLTEETI